MTGEPEQAIIEALREAGRDGLPWHLLSQATGLGSLVNLPLRDLRAQDVVRLETWPRNEDDPEDMGEAYYLTAFTEPGDGGMPLVSVVTQRHDCPRCDCTAVVSDAEQERRAMLRTQQGVLRTLRRKGPLSRSAIAQAGFKGEGRKRVGPALAAMAEVGKVSEDARGVWSITE